MEIQQYNPRCVQVALQVAFGNDDAAIAHFCRQVGIEPESLTTPTAHFTSAQFERIWLDLQSVFQSPYVGLLEGQRMGLAMGGIVNLIAQVSPTLQIALQQFGQFHELFTDQTYYERFAIDETGPEIYLEITLSTTIAEQSPFFARSTAECMFVVALRALSEYGKRAVKPSRVAWAFEPPAGIDLYQEIFRCPMQFGQPYNRLYFSRKELQRPVITHNAVLYQHFLQVINSYLADQQLQHFPHLIRTSLLKRLYNHQSLAIEEIAEDLNLSVRTLQRKLEQHQIAFQQICEEIRREVALQLIQKGHHNVNEIACLTGYKEASSFRRAFKRWTGQNPKAFQAPTL